MRWTPDDLAGTVDDFIPRISGPVPCSPDSAWQRISRFERVIRQWESSADAIASVDADTFEMYAYHPCPINCERYAVTVGLRSWSEVAAHKRLVDELEHRLRDLMNKQDELWQQETVNDRASELLAIEIATCRERLAYERSFDQVEDYQ